jgi:hypothetical protein
VSLALGTARAEEMERCSDKSDKANAFRVIRVMCISFYFHP